MRRAGFGRLLCPEFTLRGLPRITVRGHLVQGVCFPLRKAPLRSRVCSWSSKRPCGPLAFRRATEGSRVLRKVWGVKRGKKTLVVFPLLPPPPGGGNARPAHRQSVSPPAAHRCIGGDQPSAEGKEKRAAYGLPSADGKKKNAPAFEPHPVK